jgi:hypothetical protein
MARNPIFPLRLDAVRRTRWEQAAAREGLTLTSWLKRAGDHAAAVALDLKAIGSITAPPKPKPDVRLVPPVKDFKGPDPKPEGGKR